MDVYGRMIHEGKLLHIYMKDEEFISKYNSMIEDGYLNHIDEVIHYDYEEDNYVGMGFSIRHGNEATAEYSTVKRINIREY